ncbi:carbohydrate-binding domain-containing protein [Sphingobacterium wenxiniae]|uniref:Carbohydrate-binding domain-containing protein n=1 Tax=Sphingobacterium wenxiniae TaxID=683125 RepID=A0A1I6S5D4_9SPHI|nr:carbohydrate-binding domain-containing protein [Sphingobacterium wenxiniae]SFS72189.1 protein of unknown function [Sphingobacterium wenxiniae]
MKTKIYFSFFILLLASAGSCTKDDGFDTSEEGSTVPTGTAVSITGSVTFGTKEGSQETGANEDDLLTNSAFSSIVKIAFNGNTATVENTVNGVTITKSAADVVIESSVSEVAYELSGSTTDGSVKIYSDKKFKLTLNGVSITNTDGPAINIQSGKRAFVVLAEGTTNKLVDGSTYVSSTEDQKGTFFSEGQLLFSGSGTLEVTGNYKHGIVSDDYIRVSEGNIQVVKAASDGLHSNDGIFIDSGTLDITASSDGIEAEEGQIFINDGNIRINVADDGLVASYENDDSIDPYIVINGGTINITTTGEGGEGIESKRTLTINGGDIYIKAVDDAINAGKAIYINGGNVVAYSTTNDGIDSNGILTVTGGRIFAIGAKSPEAGFDCDNNTFKITGGLLVGVGGSTSTPTANASSQAAAILGSGNAGTIYSILDSDNGEVITFKSPVSFTTLLLSSNKFSSGKTYKFVSVSNISDASEFNGIYLGGSFSDPTLSSSFTLTSMVTRIGGSTGPGR